MSTLNEALSRLAVSAQVDDLSVPIVLSAMHRLQVPPPGRNDMERASHFIRRMFDRGFIAVDSPYAGDAPWPEQGEAALRRLRREWEALDHEPTFADLCWFRLP